MTAKRTKRKRKIARKKGRGAHTAKRQPAALQRLLLMLIMYLQMLEESMDGRPARKAKARRRRKRLKRTGPRMVKPKVGAKAETQKAVPGKEILT